MTASDLPDLHNGGEIIPDNIRAMAARASILRWLAVHCADLTHPSASSTPDPALIASGDQWLAASAAPDPTTTDP